jgi:glycosyltransferase involved in cell wall biosynthesis
MSDNSLTEGESITKMKDKLNILFLCNKSPWPAREGGPIAMNNIIEGMYEAGHNVKVLALNTNKYQVQPEDIPENYRKKTKIELVYVDLSIRMFDAFFNLFTNKSYHVERFISKKFDEKLIEVLEENKFDIVQIELLFMSPYIKSIRKYSDARIVLRAHNIEHLIWERLESSVRNPVKKFYLRHLAKTLKHYEMNILQSYNGIVPITEKDATFFKEHTTTPVYPVSFGIDTSKIKTSDIKDQEHALFHIGAMNWLPNEEGIKWFLEHVWPKVHQLLPGIKLYLAGREMPDWLINTDLKNVFVVGEVEDAQEFIESKAISIAPLLSGSGIRIKIIESMALGKAVISTSIGAEGINYTNKQNILIADTPEEFVQAIQFLFNDPVQTKRIGDNASKLIRQQHDSKKIIEQLVQFYHQIF